VTKGGPAEKAGVREGDIITAMDGISISTTSQLITYLKYYAAGEEIDFSISRLNEDETAFEKEKITITLGNRKDSGIDESTENSIESAPSDNTENGGFDVIPDQKR
jgi:S1-C subfamily serine protease